MKSKLFALLLVIVAFSCKKESQLEKKIAQIGIEIKIERFDTLFAKASSNKLLELKKEYPFMFFEKYEEDFWLAKQKDTIQQMLSREVEKTFVNTAPLALEIESLFNHLKYYFFEFRAPRVITTTNSVDYRNKVIVTDTIALIALDTYLGADHDFYAGIQKYLRSNFKKEQLVVDLASAYAKKYSYNYKRHTLLDEMIYSGKQLYFKDLVIPFKTEAERIGYTPEQLNWAISNESYIWRYFVERELLFSTDSKLPSRFINDAPFSKFYLETIDSSSPGRLGQYIGWQIVRAYMQQNKVSLKEMLIKSSEEIFNNSKFKPRK